LQIAAGTVISDTEDTSFFAYVLHSSILQVRLWAPRKDPLLFRIGARGSLLVKALGYKPEGRGFETRLDEILNLPNPSGRARPWGLLIL
jgi:hypothetical protein